MPHLVAKPYPNSIQAMRIRVAVKTLVLALFVGGTTGCGYNRIQQLDEAAAKAKQNISVQLQRRADLVPNLVETVKGYAKQEAEI